MTERAYRAAQALAECPTATPGERESARARMAEYEAVHGKPVSQASAQDAARQAMRDAHAARYTAWCRANGYGPKRPTQDYDMEAREAARDMWRKPAMQHDEHVQAFRQHQDKAKEEARRKAESAAAWKRKARSEAQRKAQERKARQEAYTAWPHLEEDDNPFSTPAYKAAQR